jgi:PiT family inorganic phosphate transporter
MTFWIVLSAVLFLAYANGANDNFKGVSTLYGSGVSTFREALLWATFTTAIGAITALFVSKGLLTTFSGKGLVPDSVVALKSFAISVVFAAAVTVMLATRFGFPISTTHALTGALVGAGFLASSQGVNLEKLKSSFFFPLLLSPILSLGIAATFYYGLKTLIRKYLGATRTTLSPKWIDRLHYLSAGTVCFARALNDTPKIAAILLLGAAISPTVSLLCVAAFMAIGGWLNSVKVAETMSRKVTEMNPGQGLAGNLTTGFLVVSASKLGLPVSTTHVACGSLFGIGLVTHRAHYKMIGGILLAWVTTLPVAAALGGIGFWFFSKFDY